MEHLVPKVEKVLLLVPFVKVVKVDFFRAVAFDW